MKRHGSASRTSIRQYDESPYDRAGWSSAKNATPGSDTFGFRKDVCCYLFVIGVGVQSALGATLPGSISDRHRERGTVNDVR